MKSFSLCLAVAALIAALGTGLTSNPAAAISIEDSAGNPDAAAPLTDPDDVFSSDQNGGFSITSPSQNGDTSQQIILTMPPLSGSGDGQSQ